VTSKKKSLLHKKDINTLKEALEYIDKLKSRIRKIEKDARSLRSNIKSYKKVWNKTEVYLEDAVDDKTLTEVIKDIEVDNKLNPTKKSCNNCGGLEMSVLTFNKHKFIICNKCKDRSKIDEKSS